jgi:hypothetical protein
MSTTTTEAGILSRLIQPETGGWDPQAARAVLSLSFSQADRERMTCLLEKSKADALTEEERSELLSFHGAGRTLEILKAKARLSLNKAA